MLDVCDRYLREICRLYGQACADASVRRHDGNGCYLISVAIEGASGFELDGIPEPHIRQQVEGMIVELSRRKPGMS